MNRRISLPSNTAQVHFIVDNWNAIHPVGSLVEVTKDNGNVEETTTTSEAWVLSGCIAVVKLAGISGCYNLNRVRPIKGPTK
jgi:hypothetical protein